MYECSCQVYLKQTSLMYILLSVTRSMPCHTIVRLITFHVYTSNAFNESSSPLLSFMLTTQSGSSPSCSFSQLSWNTGQCIQSWNVLDPGLNYAEYVCNAVTLVWGSLRLAPFSLFLQLCSSSWRYMTQISTAKYSDYEYCWNWK